MKNFTAPVLVDITDMAEGVYAASGAGPIPTPAPTPEPTAPPFSHSLEFNDLDSGSYSVVRFKANGVDSHVYSGIKVVIDFNPGQCNSILDTVWEVNGSDCSKNVYKQGTSAIIEIGMQKRNTSETVEVAFKTTFNHNFINELHPENSNHGSYDGYSEDGKNIPNRDVCCHANVSIIPIFRL